MNLELTVDEARALKRYLRMGPQHGATMTHAVYIHPAQQLRNRADEIEQDERDSPLLQSMLKKLTEQLP